MGECDAAPLGIQSSPEFSLSASRSDLLDANARPWSRRANGTIGQRSNSIRCGNRNVGHNRLGTPDGLKHLHERKGVQGSRCRARRLDFRVSSEANHAEHAGRKSCKTCQATGVQSPRRDRQADAGDESLRRRRSDIAGKYRLAFAATTRLQDVIRPVP